MKIRFMTGDTDSTRVQALDEEIYGVLTYEPSPAYAAAIVADALAAKYSFQVSTVNGSMRIAAEHRMSHYMKLADRLRAGGPGDVPGDPNLNLSTMSVQGTSIAAKDAILSDSDNVQNVFKLGQDDHPDTGSSGTVGF